MLSAEPICAKLRTDTLLAKFTELLSDTELPSEKKSMMERELFTSELPRTDMPLPTRNSVLSDKEEPRFTASRTDKCDEKRP
jgi:hypothetical protein